MNYFEEKICSALAITPAGDGVAKFAEIAKEADKLLVMLNRVISDKGKLLFSLGYFTTYAASEHKHLGHCPLCQEETKCLTDCPVVVFGRTIEAVNRAKIEESESVSR